MSIKTNKHFDALSNYLDCLPHAKLRICQRNFRIDEIEQVVKFGHHFHRAGREIYFLAKSDIPKNKEKEMSRLIGLTVILTGQAILTAYRNPNAIKKIKRQSKLKHIPIYEFKQFEEKNF